MLGVCGVLGGLALLIYLALRGANLMIISIVCAAVVALGNGLSLSDALMGTYMAGLAGFLQQFFLLFLFGAIFGRLMGDSGAASSIAHALARAMGAGRALLIVVLASAVLSYGGVSLFVLVFTIYPLGLGLIKQANLPKRLFCGALALGCGTFTMTALPGTPAIQNLIPAQALGTPATAAPLVGTVAGVVMFALGYWYLRSQTAKARAKGEGFVPGPADTAASLSFDAAAAPHWALALVPMAAVIGMVIATRSLQPPLAWVSAALALGCLITVALFWRRLKTLGKTLSEGAGNAVMPILYTSSVIGFGTVVSTVPAFKVFATALSHLSWPPLLSAAVAVNVMAGLMGSASGGLRIFMQTMAPGYLAAGVDPALLHRISALATALGALPHSGAVVSMLAVVGLTHREAYKDVFVVALLVPLAGLAVALVMALTLPL